MFRRIVEQTVQPAYRRHGDCLVNGLAGQSVLRTLITRSKDFP